MSLVKKPDNENAFNREKEEVNADKNNTDNNTAKHKALKLFFGQTRAE